MEKLNLCTGNQLLIVNSTRLQGSKSQLLTYLTLLLQKFDVLEKSMQKLDFLCKMEIYLFSYPTQHINNTLLKMALLHMMTWWIILRMVFILPVMMQKGFSPYWTIQTPFKSKHNRLMMSKRTNEEKILSQNEQAHENLKFSPDYSYQSTLLDQTFYIITMTDSEFRSGWR